jgi:hypothetical protein
LHSKAQGEGAPVDIRLSLSQWVALNCRLNAPRGPLTPLSFEFEDPSVTPALDVKKSLPAGGVLKKTLPLLESLADPRAVNGLTFALPGQIVDTSIYHVRSGEHRKTIAITGDGGSLRVQSPAPIEELLALLQSRILQASGPASSATLELPILPAWLCWAFIDLVRESARAGEAPEVATWDLAALTGVLERPFRFLTNLAAYFREALELSLPSKPEVQAALRQLTDGGVITHRHGKYAAGEFICQLADELGDLQAHLLFRTTALMPDGRAASMRNWIFQGRSGNGLLWQQANGRVSLVNLSRDGIITLAAALIRHPRLFFIPPQERPASPEKLPPVAAKRRPPAPESLG